MTDITLDLIQINFGRLKTALSMNVALRGLRDSVPRRLLKVIHTHFAEAEQKNRESLTQRIEEELARSRDQKSGGEFYTKQKELTYLLTVLSNLDGTAEWRSNQARESLLPVIKNRYQSLQDQDRRVRRMIGLEIHELLSHPRQEIRNIASQIRDEAVSPEEVEQLSDFSAPAAVRDEVLRRMIANHQLSEFLPKLEAYLRNVGTAEFQEMGRDYQEYIKAIGRVLADHQGAQGYLPTLLGRILSGELRCHGLWLTLAMQLGEAGLDYILRTSKPISPLELRNVWPLVIEHAHLQNRKAVDFVANVARDDSDLGLDAMRKLARFNSRPAVTPYLHHKLSELRTYYKTRNMLDRLKELDRRCLPQMENLEPIVDRQLNEDYIEPAAYKRLEANRHATLKLYLRRFHNKPDRDQLPRSIPYVRDLFDRLYSDAKRRNRQSKFNSEEWGSVLADILMDLLRESKEAFPAETARHIVLILVRLRFHLDYKNSETVYANAEAHTEFHQFLREHWSQLFRKPATIRWERDGGQGK